MHDSDVASGLGAISAIFMTGVVVGTCGTMIYSDPMTMRNMYRAQLWEEAVAAGVAERLETEQGPGYKWKENSNER